MTVSYLPPDAGGELPPPDAEVELLLGVEAAGLSAGFASLDPPPVSFFAACL